MERHEYDFIASELELQIMITADLACAGKLIERTPCDPIMALRYHRSGWVTAQHYEDGAILEEVWKS